MAEVLVNILLGLTFILVFSFIPALSFSRILDKNADWTQRLLLLPSIGLFFLLSIAGISVILLGSFSAILIFCLVIISNFFAIRYFLNDEAILQEPLNLSVSSLLKIGIVLVIFCSLLPLFLFEVPNGVDWIGFATLSNLYVVQGMTELSAPAQVSWTYPPAFPALAAWLQILLDIPASDAVHLLGRLSLMSLLLGIAGIAQRWNAAAYTLISCALGFGLFVKAHDTGYPTIASLIGLIIGCSLILQNKSERTRTEHSLLAFVILITGLIHPSGSIYLAALMLAELIAKWRLNGITSNRMIIATVLTLILATLVTIIFFSSRMKGMDIHAEYGWQGGAALLLFNGPILLILGLWSAWRMRHVPHGLTLGAWLGVLWIISTIHLLAGLEIFAVLTLFSYVLYSMALHAFHIPLALLVGILLTSAVENNISVKTDIPNWLPKASVALCIIFLIIGQSALIILSSHDEIRVDNRLNGDLKQYLEEMPHGTIIYSEQAHWGYYTDAPKGIHFTSYPIIGLMQEDGEIQDRATSAIRSDDLETLQKLGIRYALSSPMGLLAPTLLESELWKVIAQENGMRLWVLANNVGDFNQGLLSTPSQDDCQNTCQWRPDSWSKHRWWGHDEITDSRAFLSQGTISWKSNTSTLNQTNVNIELFFDAPRGVELEFSTSVKSKSVLSKGGWQSIILSNQSSQGDFTFTVNVDKGGQLWLNPSGLTGRGDRLFDESGIMIHWVEIQPIN